MAGVDYRYRKWQTAAAKKIVEQIVNGTLEQVAVVGARVGKTTKEDAMVSQIVGILMSHHHCDECGGTGEIDSGGFTPWGQPISVPCGCSETKTSQ